MKRWIAGLLAVGMAAALSLAPAMAETGVTAGGEGSTSIAENTGQTVGEPAAGADLRFSQLRKTLEKNNYNVKALQANLEDLEDQDTDELRDAVDMLETMKSGLQSSLQTVTQTYEQLKASASSPPSGGDASTGEGTEGGDSTGGGMTFPDPNTAALLVALGGLQAALGADIANIEMQISTMESQIESMDSTIETSENTIRNAIDQIVKGAETLYIGIVTMESSLDAIQRGIDTMDRTIAIYEKQYELGMVSQYEVEAMTYQRTSLASQLDSLIFQIQSSKVTLEGLCGLPLQGTVQLGGLSIPTAGDLSAMNYEKDLAKGQARNVDVLNAKVDLKSGRDDAKEYTLQAAEDTFAYNFKVLYMTVGEKNRLVDVAREALSFQQRTFEITAKQYELGMISQEEYRAGESDLLAAQESVTAAQLELFTAYRNYEWARDYGLI